jgi:hypothetical protein
MSTPLFVKFGSNLNYRQYVMKIFLAFSMINILFVGGVCVANALTKDNSHSIEIITYALTKIDKPKTLKVAESLECVNPNFSTYDLII